jgi:hypothetical protein
MPGFPMETVFVASGPDFAAEVLNLGKDTEQALADLLREHGPEGVTIYAQGPNGVLVRLLGDTAHTGRDDIAKYYLTTFTHPHQRLEIQVGWDS